MRRSPPIWRSTATASPTSPSAATTSPPPWTPRAPPAPGRSRPRTAPGGLRVRRRPPHPAAAVGARRPPAARGPAWIPTPNPGPLPPWRRRIERLDHVAVCLEQGTLQDSVRRYTEGFGLSRYSSEQIEVGDQAMRSTVVRSATGLITFTILEPDPVKGSGQLDGFLARNRGAGVQHLAFLVDDIVLAVRDFEDRGVEFLRTPDAYYEMLADRLIDLRGQTEELRATNVLADRDEWGYLLQLFSRSPHERNTLFYELIQRRGAQGFGTANIKALYEAVDRARTAEEPVLHAQDGAAQ
ncbi:VOC family protein [Catenulispora yoronensis]